MLILSVTCMSVQNIAQMQTSLFFFTFSAFVLLDLEVIYISFPVGSREVACKLKTLAVKISQHIQNESKTRLVPHFLSVQCFYFVV